MNNPLLRATRDGEPARGVLVTLVALAMSIALGAWYLVWSALPSDAVGAQLALPVLLLGAVPGLFQAGVGLVKIYQGGRVRLDLR